MKTINSLTSEQLQQLRTIFSQDGQLLTDQEAKQTYGRDWTKQYAVAPSAIVFPKSTDDVQKLVRWARTNKFSLVPSGGRTGLSGGAVASFGEIVVSFEKMNRILDFNPVDRTVRVEPGVITETLQNYIHDQGFYYPVDFAARGSSHIGGNIATNAGGVKVIRYGSTREWILGLKVVTGTGEILNFNHELVKNATGFDFRHLMIGSEGTLGFVVEATLKFTVPPKPLTVLILGVPDLDAIMNVFRKLRDALPLTAFEFFSDLALKHVIDSTHLPKPLPTDCPLYVLIEVENTFDGIQAEILTAFESCMESGWVLDGVVSQNEQQARGFWRLREDISEATAKYTPYKNDISVTIARVPEFLSDVDALLTKNYPDFEVVWFGHIGDGNMHINILKPAALAKEEFLAKCVGVSRLLFEVVKKYDGSISAEHGVGLVKKPFLHFTRTAAEIQLMKQIKLAFDPDGILNPGKIFD